MTDQEFLHLIATSLGMPPEAITPDTPVETIAEWDSLGWLSIMTAVDERWDVLISTQHLSTCQTVGEVMAHLRDKLAAKI